MQEISTSIQDWLKKQRVAQGMEQIELAELAGLESSSIGRIENGRTNPTLYAVIRICFGLGLSQKDFMYAIGLSTFLPEHQGARSDKGEVLTIEDIEAFYNFYRNQPMEAKGYLYKTFAWIRFLAGKSSAETMERDGAEIIGEMIRAQNLDLPTLPYPEEIGNDSFWEIYISGGVITLKDVGLYMRRVRQNKNLSLRDLAKAVNNTHTAIRRLEMGAIERIDITDLIAVDRVIGVENDILTLCWAAGEFHTGILRNKLSDERQDLPPLGWQPEEFNFAMALSMIERWYYQYQHGNIDWLKELRILAQ
jgi:transcriptional regulator with XRE-family HTH domain